MPAEKLRDLNGAVSHCHAWEVGGGGEYKTHPARGAHKLAQGAVAAPLADRHLGRVVVSAVLAIGHLGSVLEVCWRAGWLAG